MKLTEIQKEFETALREAYQAPTRRKRNIRLPSALVIEQERDGLLLRLDAKSVTSNMQTDAAAAEAWALALRLWLGEKRVPHIVLDWEAPPELHNGHYERFLYRVDQFRKLFPWFEVADPQKLQKCRALCETRLIINVASRRTSQSEPKTKSREYEFERALIKSKQFQDEFRLDLIDRQFPVGLFVGEVKAATRIFTGGKSAIDIVGVGKDKRLWIFELKAGENISVGSLSELLLYTGLIREAANESQRIKFDRPKRDSGIGPQQVTGCTGINAVMLVENLHPLLKHPKLLDTLNNAAKTCWNRETGAKPVCFSKARVVEVDGKVLVTDFESATVTSA